MPKARTQFVCQVCGKTSAKEWSRCPDCGEWDTFVESVIEVRQDKANLAPTASFSTQDVLPKVKAGDFQRLFVPIADFNRVLGGGVVPGRNQAVADSAHGQDALRVLRIGLEFLMEPAYVSCT